MRIEKRITNPKNYDGERPTGIKYIVIQNIGNRHSPHYHISEGKVIQIIPDGNMSNSVNGGKVNACAKLHGICTKYNSISIGICNDLSEDDKQACIDLIMTLIQRYNIDKNNVVRKKDVTGCLDPTGWCDDNTWTKEIVNCIIDL